MPDLVAQITNQFLEELENQENVTSDQVEKLRGVLKKSTKIKPKEIEAIFISDQDDVQ